MELQDHTVVVTGGASGIGKATALLLAREGARVVVGDIDEAGGRATAVEAAAENLAVEFLPLDLVDALRSRPSPTPPSHGPSGWTGSSTPPAGTKSSRFSKIRPRCGIASLRST